MALIESLCIPSFAETIRHHCFQCCRDLVSFTFDSLSSHVREIRDDPFPHYY
jgi:hypothetical protein